MTKKVEQNTVPKNCLLIMLPLVITQTVRLYITASRVLEQSIDRTYLFAMR